MDRKEFNEFRDLLLRCSHVICTDSTRDYVQNLARSATFEDALVFFAKLDPLVEILPSQVADGYRRLRKRPAARRA